MLGRAGVEDENDDENDGAVVVGSNRVDGRAAEASGEEVRRWRWW